MNNLSINDSLIEEYQQDYDNILSPKYKEPNQFNSMCLNSITIGGFIRDQNSIENEILNKSNGQNEVIDEDKVVMKKKSNVYERRESINTDQKVIYIKIIILRFVLKI